MSQEWRVPAEPETQSVDQAPGSAILPHDAWLHVRDSLRLSDRELQIIQGIFDDEDQKSMANRLAISPEIVYRMIQRIYLKLRIGSSAELVVRVMSEYLAYAAEQDLSEVVMWLFWPVKPENTYAKRAR